ncbi:hypothetical protein CH35J_006202 [Colletotrichum higginsianum]|nr:hypothetical protein CH35J_006202 [Colletotrichum higginsianum]
MSPGSQLLVRGRRQGPMDPISRNKAKETRDRKMECIRCKLSKQECRRNDDTLNGPCIGCEKHGGSQRWPGPCVKAHFGDLVLSGSCNYISSYAIYHLTLNNDTRIRRELPKRINLDELVGRVDQARRKFNFEVYQGGQPLYVLDLDSCHDYLQGLRNQMDVAEHDFPAFIDIALLQADTSGDDWEKCMTQTTSPPRDWLSLLCDVNRMPSRASFSYVSRPNISEPAAVVERPINVEDPDDADDLILAAQLSRIVCRKLEVKAYHHLQCLLYDWGTMEDGRVLTFLQSLGRILLTLRWRLSWWAAVPSIVVGDGTHGSKSDDANQQRVESRVRSLCWILYFYYCAVRRRLPVSDNEMLAGVYTEYPGAEKVVWDDFPGDESIKGFEAWIERGRELINEAGVLDRLER